MGSSDTKLTDNGKQQAKNTGIELNRNTTFNKDINGATPYLFCSDLLRTRQTLTIVLHNISSIANTAPLIVLPCSHELAYNADGNCDGSIINKSFVPTENRTSSLNHEEQLKVNEPDIPPPQSIHRNINWEYYNTFYKETAAKRDISNLGCIETNFLKEAIKIIKDPPAAPPVATPVAAAAAAAAPPVAAAAAAGGGSINVLPDVGKPATKKTKKKKKKKTRIKAVVRMRTADRKRSSRRRKTSGRRTKKKPRKIKRAHHSSKKQKQKQKYLSKRN